MSKYDWSSFPRYLINVSNLSVPAEICTIFKKYNIDKYVYQITYKGIVVVKFGMSSAKSSSRIWGERVYRQIAHCYSWGKNRIDGSSGADWLIIERDFKQKYGVDLDHNHLTITVWDITNYNFRSFDPFKEVEAMESEKINEYVQLMGQKPIGNINDEANKKNRPFVDADTFNDIFVLS